MRFLRPLFLLLLFAVFSTANSALLPNTINKGKSVPALMLHTKTPGNPAIEFPVTLTTDNKVKTDCGSINLQVAKKVVNTDKSIYTLTIKALEDVNFHISMKVLLSDMPHDKAYFLLPGLWYKHNLKVSEGAPSMSVANSWSFREDRLSTPLTAVYNPESKRFYSLRRCDKLEKDCLLPYNSGEVIMYGDGDIGSVGFGETGNESYLTCSYPVSEYPKSYTGKLRLTRPIMVFRNLSKGESIQLNYEVYEGNVDNYSDFVKNIWQYTYNSTKPAPIKTSYSKEEVKKVLSNYYKESFTDAYPIKGYSGVHVNIDQCEKRGIIEIGFIGRVLLNAFYALQYGEQTKDQRLIDDATSIYESYLKNGFTTNGFIREKVDFAKGIELKELSIRRQSEGIMALFYWLDYEKSKKRTHPEWEARIKDLLENIMDLQREDYSFPRKFTDSMEVVDSTGGSSSCVVLPLTMAYKYFNNPKYLEVAEKTANYIKKESVDKGDYFSSTLDARCEDKEASIYITTAYYYLWLATGKQEYVKQASQSVYFSLSYYYTWDVPFAKGQLLGDLGLKTRGWGNVSVENNHIDVYNFEFLDVLRWLSKQTGDKRLEDFSKVISSSTQDQLLPVEGRLCGIAKPGYYPEVVQHTHWDYGFNGKGYYNTLFGPGWVVASLWTMLSSGNTESFFN